MDETCIKLKRKCTCPRFPNGEERVNEGQSVKVKLVGFDDRGKVRLSMKVVDQETGEEITKEG